MSKPNSTDRISEIINRRQQKLMIRKGYFALLRKILFIGIATWLLFTQVFLVARTNGNDMFPAVKDGDVVLAFRLQKTYLKEDAVVYQLDGKRYIGRIIASENDVVAMDDSGTIRVNGTVQTGEILYPTFAKDGLSYPYRVPEGAIFILGDNRPQAKDSRDFGAIPRQQVEGKIITLLRRRGL